jgi:hypothetical protein
VEYTFDDEVIGHRHEWDEWALDKPEGETIRIRYIPGSYSDSRVDGRRSSYWMFASIFYGIVAVPLLLLIFWERSAKPEPVRVRLRKGEFDTPLGALLPVSGRVVQSGSSPTEWAIVALDHPVSVTGATAELLWVRPTISGCQVGGPSPIPVHVSLVSGVTEGEGRPRYRVGEMLGQAVCEAESNGTTHPAQ